MRVRLILKGSRETYYGDDASKQRRARNQAGTVANSVVVGYGCTSCLLVRVFDPPRGSSPWPPAFRSRVGSAKGLARRGANERTNGRKSIAQHRCQPTCLPACFPAAVRVHLSVYPTICRVRSSRRLHLQAPSSLLLPSSHFSNFARVLATCTNASSFNFKSLSVYLLFPSISLSFH